ncbi:MAG TPA: hypothetical protein VNK95_22010, partial [Caldilineaceae bacterium]|nr:hypothetical protein [Caldilineaceae bacterium]
YTADPLAEPAAQLVPLITPATLATVGAGLGGSHGVDVTGGMAAKVRQALAWIERWPGLEVLIGSGLAPGVLHTALCAPEQAPGTRIRGGSPDSFPTAAP